MSRDEVNCCSVILSDVAECSVKILDDVDVFVTECQFGVSRTISQPGFLIQSGDFVVDQAFDVRLQNWALEIHWLCQSWPAHLLFHYPTIRCVQLSIGSLDC